MKAILKGILVVLVTLALAAAFIPKAHAGTMEELEALLEGVSKLYPKGDGIGTCYFDKKGVLTFKEEERVTTKRCIVGFKIPDFTQHYLLLGDENGPSELLIFDETTKSQKSVWRKGNMV